MPDPCDFCLADDCDFGEHDANCPNNDANAPQGTPDLYYGFIQALCWASGAKPLTFNEPDELWLPSDGDNIIFSRTAFLHHLAEFDDGPVMMLKKTEGGWEIFCTEHPDSLTYDEAEKLGFAFAAEWADRG